MVYCRKYGHCPYSAYKVHVAVPVFLTIVYQVFFLFVAETTIQLPLEIATKIASAPLLATEVRMTQ